jgi:3-phenylpropionate/trans-cinnamate dioxygenase ferredoxin reductase subunit
MTTTTVIVGAGQAGSDLTTALRQLGYAGRIILIGDEQAPPYRRPPLSKAYLSGEIGEEALYLKPLAAYEKQNVELRTGVKVTAIDRDAHTVTLDNGEVIKYDKLALTTGGRARRLPLPGAEKPNVHYVRTLADIEHLKAQFKEGNRLVIVGGGYIGLEAAAVGAELSQYYHGVHSTKGVDIRLGAGVQALEGDKQVDAVILQDGTRIPADLLIVGIGLIPNTELAEQAGLAVDNGVLVDLYAQTSDPDIVAAGDCTNHENGFLGRRLRLESVPNASEQARVAAASIIGQQVAHAGVPWFWSDQYDLKLQMVGLSQGYDQVVIRGSMEAHNFSAFYLKDGVVISVDCVNRPQDFMVGKKLVAAKVKVDPAVLADESVALKSLL